MHKTVTVKPNIGKSGIENFNRNFFLKEIEKTAISDISEGTKSQYENFKM